MFRQVNFLCCLFLQEFSACLYDRLIKFQQVLFVTRTVITKDRIGEKELRSAAFTNIMQKVQLSPPQNQFVFFKTEQEDTDKAETQYYVNRWQ